ncbi:Protein of uncharacterised function DUF262 [Serratia ficaria]|uniref:DUF262 domain-containing protein n=1 Tax=Serratia ficaria TaxID=61651 RepID=UPI0021835595|nr:DUF262 domain-containing protein [Serratia ficaria]CAI2520532.1 Protein of uncharacterised function DUF262 [Serratia ficaria]
MTNKKIDEHEVDEWFSDEVDEIEASEVGSSTPSQSIEDKFSISQLKVIRTSMDFTLHHLKQSLEDDDYINAAPKYQRRHRWDIRKRSQLIESFLMNIPVPPIFLYENDYNQYEIMDGRQRIDTLRSFMNNEFPLRGLEFWNELDGKRFSDLPSIIQRGLSRRTINAVVLLAETNSYSDDDIDIRKILFKRLNTGGVQLNPQELRNALYPGKFNELVSKLSRTDLFTNAWGIPRKTSNEETDPSPELLKNTLFRSMADCELVLRFFGIRKLITEGTLGSLRKVLDKTAKAYQTLDDNEVQELERIFLTSLAGLHDIFKDDLFVMPATGKLSRPLYDAFMVAYSLIDYSSVFSHEKIKNSLAQIEPDTTNYDILIGKGNTTEAIRERVELASSILIQ